MSSKKARWRDLQPIWTDPTGKHTLYRITHPGDLVQWGQMMKHSGGRYRKWVIDTPIWHFYTFLDSKGRPYVTVHAKNVDWWLRAHPDDKMAAQRWPWGFGPCPVDANGRAIAWVPSTTYDNLSWRYRQSTIMVDGEELVIMAAGHRDADPLLPNEEVLLDQWYQEVRSDNATS